MFFKIASSKFFICSYNAKIFLNDFQMSIVPMMFRDWWDEWDRPSRLLDQHFGVGLRRDDLLSSFPNSSLLRNTYYRPWRTNLGRQESSSTVNLTKDKFEVGNFWLSATFE